MSASRTESDSLGTMQVPADAYWGAQTQRAIQNFPISGTPMPREFIHAHVLLKKAAVAVNRDLGLLKPELAAAIIQAADEILANADWSKNQFPIDIYQTGSGTSTNMNVNEVLASCANEILGGKRRRSRTTSTPTTTSIWANPPMTRFRHRFTSWQSCFLNNS